MNTAYGFTFGTVATHFAWLGSMTGGTWIEGLAVSACIALAIANCLHENPINR